MSKKLTFKFVKQYFEERDCELLETEYINNHTLMRYICDCGNEECKISFNNFKKGARCIECKKDKRRLTFKYVYNYFKEHDCELFETEYIDNRTLMEYRCDCGNDECKISFANFQNGNRCKKCGIKKMAEKRRLLFKDVRKYFEDHDCKLLEKEYINNNTPMKYECDCGNDECEITFDSFKSGSRCMKCSGNEKYTYKDVKKYFEDYDCKLLVTEYINTSTPMEYECECGNSDCKICFSSFKNGNRCRKCGNKKIGDKKRFTFEFVKQYFEDHDCELFETEYINSWTLMKYRCDCGNEKCKIAFSNFKRGHRCKKCGIEKISGENNSNYNLNLTDEEREENRYRPGRDKWRKLVLKKYKNTCQYCFQVNGKLIAHHIEGHANNKDIRLVVSNGIIFCEKHHKEFHKIYGKKNITRKKLEKYLSTRDLKIN